MTGVHQIINSFKDTACVLFIFVSFLASGTRVLLNEELVNGNK